MDEQPERQQEPASSLEHSVAGMDNFVPPVKPKHVLKGFLKLLLILIVIVAIGGGIFWFVTNHKTSKQPATPAKTPAVTTQNTATPKISSTTKQYDSTNYNLSFKYPTDWTVADTASSKLTATSPALQLKDSSGQAFTGQVVFAVQNKQTSLSQFAAGKAVAALESQKIAYAKPTPNQRAQTYVSFVSYSGSTSSIDALYVAGDNGYQAGQNIPQSDVIQADPLVNISFLKCGDDTCKSAGTPVAIDSSEWADTSLSKPLLTMLESLIIE